jgi:hypothetical protein
MNISELASVKIDEMPAYDCFFFFGFLRYQKMRFDRLWTRDANALLSSTIFKHWLILAPQLLDDDEVGIYCVKSYLKRQSQRLYQIGRAKWRVPTKEKRRTVVHGILLPFYVRWVGELMMMMQVPAMATAQGNASMEIWNTWYTFDEDKTD